LSAFILIIAILVIINYLRKLHWDVIHHNLLDLVDDIGGKVIRQGMLGRPIYHGQYKKLDITINFSTEKINKNRRNLIDISIGTPIEQSFTISSFNWLEEREESALSEFSQIELQTKNKYGIRNISVENLVKKNSIKKFYQNLEKLNPFLFLYAGKNGIIYEKEGGNLAISTKHPAMKDEITSLAALVGVLN
jgi:hypothetical protein